MNIIFLLTSATVVFLMAFFAFAIWKLSEDKLDLYQKICRNPKIGVIVGFPLVCWCVPHTQAIIFSWAEPYLWYAAIVLTVLSYFYLDYLFARALGGAFIIGAYCIVHGAYEFQVPGAISITLLAWLWGIAGIFISGKPSFLRDYFRKCAAVKRFKIASYIIFAVTAVCFAYSIIGGLLK